RPPAASLRQSISVSRREYRTISSTFIARSGSSSDTSTTLMKTACRAVSLVALALCRPGLASAEPVAVRHAEGLVHGFLVLRSPQGALLASGDLIQTARGNRVTNRLGLRFKDGSLHDETAVFSQAGHFQLLSD